MKILGIDVGITTGFVLLEGKQPQVWGVLKARDFLDPYEPPPGFQEPLHQADILVVEFPFLSVHNPRFRELQALVSQFNAILRKTGKPLYPVYAGVWKPQAQAVLRPDFRGEKVPVHIVDAARMALWFQDSL